MAQGSPATLDGYPRVCTGCKQPVRITGPVPLWFECKQGVELSWHFQCRLARPAGDMTRPPPE